MFCFYCDAPVHSRDAYQYDHFPIPKSAGRRELLAWGLIDASELARFKRPVKLKLLHARFKRMPRTMRITIAKCMAIEAHSSLDRVAA